MAKIIILVGPPGSGKGTQAKILASQLNFLHVSIGDMLRRIVQKKTSLSTTVQSFIDKGSLLPYEITNKIIADFLNNFHFRQQLILDGYPREMKQAEFLTTFLNNKKINIRIVFYFSATKKRCIDNISGRRICPKCGKIYHLLFLKPKVKNICDNCSHTLIQRKDDTRETIIKRIAVYEKQTMPIVDYYRKQKLLVQIDNKNNDLKATTLKILDILKK